MAGNIIVIDDDLSRATEASRILTASQYTVDIVHGRTFGQMVDYACSFFREKEYSAMLLDMHFGELEFGGDVWGGIHLYNRVVGRGYRPRWKDTIIASRYVGEHLQAANDLSAAFVVRVFVESHQIPYDNVIYTLKGGGFTQLSARLKGLGCS